MSEKAINALEEKIQKLPPELQQELDGFLDSLIRNLDQSKPKVLKLDWRGALKELRDEYTSVGLQHKALELWGK